MRQKLVWAAVLLGASFYIVSFFIGDTALGAALRLDVIETGLSRSINIVFTFAVGLGIINLFQVHGANIARRRKDWPFSVVVVATFALVLFLLLWQYRINAAERRLEESTAPALARYRAALSEPDAAAREAALAALSPTDQVLVREHFAAEATYRFAPRRFYLEHVYTPLVASVMSLLGFYITYAAYRAFRLRSVEASVMMISAALVIIGSDPLGNWLSVVVNQGVGAPVVDLPAWADLDMRVMNSGMQRGLWIGISVAIIAVSTRILLGLEKGLLDVRAGEPQMARRLLQRLLGLDRRLVYVLLVLVLAVPFVVPYSLPIYADSATRRFYDEIERIAADPVARQQVVLVLTNWGPGTSGENEPQFRIVMRQLLRHRLRFIFLCSMPDPVYHDVALAAFAAAQDEERAWASRHGRPPPEWVYGRDWLDFGYKNAPVFAPLARTIILEPRAFFGRDYLYRRDLLDDASFPLLSDFRGIADVSAVLVFAAGDEARDVAGLVQGTAPGLRIGTAVPGIVANDLYPYVKSGQLFGLLNSARTAMEYRALLNPDEPSTRPLDNAMSLGKSLLLLLVLVGNAAYLVVRSAPPVTGQASTPGPALRPLGGRVLWSLFVGFIVVYGAVIRVETWRVSRGAGLPVGNSVAVQAAPGASRVTLAELERAAAAEAARTVDPLAAAFAAQRAARDYARLVEARVGDFLGALLTLGVFAFLLGENRFYRVIEAIIIGGAAAYLLDQVDQILRPDWWEPLLAGLSGAAPWTSALWGLLALPGVLWYFTYSQRYRWLNQLIVAAFLGLAIGPEFRKQTSLLIPQLLDSLQPIWPWAVEPAGGALRFVPSRLEHLVFVAVAVLSLLYFVFLFRPRSAAGRATLATSRLVMMVGFGAMFGNAVNTRLSWLAPRIGFLVEDWLIRTFRT